MTTLTAPRTAPAPAGPKPMTIALVLVLGAIMVSLDTTVVNVALDRLSRDFDAPLATVQWIATGYSLALAAIIPSGAWAIGRFGARRLYVTAITLFAAGSLLAGLAWNVQSLIAFRVLQGVGGGLVMPVGMTILMRAAGPERLGRLMSTLGLAILVGPLAGPVLGGWLIDEVSWRWMFFINLPIGALVVPLAWRLFPADGPARRRPLDFAGLALLSPGLAALVYGVTAGGERGDFAAPGALVPLLAGVLLIALFVVRALKAEHPLIDLGLFRERTFSAAAGTLALFSAGYFSSMLLLPLYLQVVRGESATKAGLLGIPFALASGVAMQVAGRIIDRVPPGRLVPVAIATSLTGYVLFALQLSADASYWGLGAAMLLMGAGGGATMMPAMTAASRGMTGDRGPAASTTVNLITTTMSAVGIAVASVLLSALLPVDGGLQALHRLSPQAHDAIAADLAEAFQHGYLMAIGLIALALVPALLLPRR
ncbi:DHA2 family efflux MFS transporter permease subunit [Actinomadura macrotermitis]|uniref:Multidrug export protein EmrB n=1 Tax=Actinomadura macrotermitis TaxID=2585200 RepID=A0A7K0BVH2_9ACTN|nr:DHA2 family efflux MFS transporter permease subunit [Actinomadura macrotermitis]MQY05173.1 Multidrug export protein EmrB [Actinomadura macrotermitis]